MKNSRTILLEGTAEERPLLRCKYHTEMGFSVEGMSIKLKFTLEQVT
jgi:hypothetical protein